MKVRPDCIPCYLKQAISTLRAAGIGENRMSEILYEASKTIPGLCLNETPGFNSSIVLHKVYELIGNNDPYLASKKEWNEYIIKRFDKLVDIIETSQNRLYTAFKISVAGNIIDMGITPDFDINVAMDEISSKEFDHSDFEGFKSMLGGAKKIMVIGDNSGEIVFDKILVSELIRLGKGVTYVVKSGPILNDATYDDAKEVGMTSLCRVITTGNNILGISEDYSSPEFINGIKEADIVISKGQANFEALEGSVLAGDKTFFVLRAKCQLVAECLGVKLGNIALKRNIIKYGTGLGA